MPDQDFGLYPDGLTAGTQVSSTYEGRHVSLFASEITSPTGTVVKGDPVVFGTVAGNHGVGVAFKSEVAATDIIPIDTKGIWNLSVVASDDEGNSLVTGGDPLYINTTTAVISKIRDNATQIPFGYALGQATGDGTALVIAVKVHWDPRSHWLEDQEKLYWGDLRDVSMEWDGTNLEMLPLVNDTGAFNIGNGTLSMDVQIFGNAAGSFVFWDSSLNLLAITTTHAAAANAVYILTTAEATAGQTNGFVSVITSTGDGKSGTVAANLYVAEEGNTEYVYGAYVGFAAIANKTITQAAGIFLYLSDMGNAVQHQVGISINRDITNVGIASDAFLEMRNHGGTAATAYMRLTGEATYLFDWSGTDQVVPVSDGSDSNNVSHKVAVRMADATTRYFHLFTD